ncbi:MAG: hypothetical protein HY812_00290 [Planctomycetes bacterium]|nr:hypothetical protein [Planctomycetota bacterium]
MKRILALLAGALLAVLVLAAPASSQGAPYVRVRDDLIRPGPPGASLLPAPPQYATVSPCASLAALAWHGQTVSGGGTLYPLAFMNPATIDPSGRLAFFSQVNGVARNQGIFVADALGLTAVVMGCGGGGGSGVPGGGFGDPTPLGGTFGGMFGGTVFAPAVNAGGDLIFISEVENGSSPRALFFYDAGSGTFSKVAAVGDRSPLGGNFSAIGPGSLNDAGTVVFLAMTGSTSLSDAFLWQGSAVSKIVATGDPAPGGGTFTMIGTESFGFADGTTIPIGPVPAINESGQITFRGLVSGGIASRGVFVSQGGSHQWYIKAGDPVPGGGTFFDFQGAMINEAGEVAFFADFKPTPTTFSSGWFAGKPGAWRKALAFYDPLENGTQCFGLAFSRNPMTALDEAGNVLVWTDAKYPGGTMEEKLVACAPDGTVTTVASQGDVTPLGGSFSSLQAWPSLNAAAQATVSAGTPGAAGGVLNAHFLASDVLVWQDLGFALAGVSGLPALRGSGALLPGTPGALDLTNAKPLSVAWLFLALSASYLPFQLGTLVPAPGIAPLPVPTDASGGFSLPWAAWPATIPACTELYFQYWIVDPAGPLGTSASNGLKATSR